MFRSAKMGQSSPYPGADNSLTVTLELNVDLVPPGGHALPDIGNFSPGHPVGISVVFSNLLGASAPHHTTWLAPDSTGVDGQDASCVNHLHESVNCMFLTGVGASFFKKVAKWNNETKVLEAFVIDEAPRDTELVLQFRVTNNNTGQPSPNITVAVTVVDISEVAVVKDLDTVLPGIHKAQPGDAQPLLVFMPAFEIKSIGQTSPYPGAHNSLLVTLSFNVNVRARCDYHDAVYVNISGVIGGECFDGTIPYSDPGLLSAPDYLDSTLLLGALPTNATEFSAGLVYWNGLYGLKRYFAKVMQDIEAGRSFVIQLDFVNGATPQESPDVKIMTYGTIYSVVPLRMYAP